MDLRMTCPASTKPYMDLVSFSIFPCIGASLQPIGALFRYHISFNDLGIFILPNVDVFRSVSSQNATRTARNRAKERYHRWS